MLIRRVSTVLTLLAATALAAPALHGQTDRATLVRTLDSLVADPVREGRAAGISVAVVRGSDTLLLKGYGKADLELDVPTPDGAVYAIGSVTKQFTAAAILQLRDAGKLDLDADITTYLPDFPTQGHRVTVRRLLDHTSGIKGLTEVPEFRTLYTSDFPRDSGLALIARQPFDFAPGEAMIYNNSGFWLLGLIVEKVSGMSYEDYVEQQIFAPLGMTSSRYCDQLEVTPRRVHGYQMRAGETRRASYFHYKWPYAAGSLCSSAGDMVTWLHALHGGKVLSPRSYAEMTTAATLADGTPLRYAMGVAVGQDLRGQTLIGHGGAIEGFVAYAGWYPDAELAVVVLINSQGPVSPQAIAAELAAEILPGQRQTARPFTGDAAPLVGRYIGPSRGREMVVEITQSAEGLTASINGGASQPLPWVKGWAFRPGSSILTFTREDNSGPATLLRFDQGGGYYMLRRQP
ncbi:MAG: serine hydrolase domain-containing protein [Gemmatimonadales bacterium]